MLRPEALPVFTVLHAGFGQRLRWVGASLCWSLSSSDFEEGTESMGCFPHVGRHKRQQGCLKRRITADTSNRKWQLRGRVGVGWKAALQSEGGKDKAMEDLKLGAANKCWQRLLLSSRAWSWPHLGQHKTSYRDFWDTCNEDFYYLSLS